MNVFTQTLGTVSMEYVLAVGSHMVITQKLVGAICGLMVQLLVLVQPFSLAASILMTRAIQSKAIDTRKGEQPF